MIYGLLYKIWSYQARFDIKNEMAKNQIDDIHGRFIFYIALFRYPFLAIAGLFGKKTVFTDRFFYDFLFYGSRFDLLQMNLRNEWKEMLQKLPKTYWMIQLDAPEEIVLSRKQEMSAENICFYRKNIFMLYLEKPSYLYSYINTSGSLERCAKDLASVLSLIHKKRA